ncbi:MAG: transglycosylase SLT domain-containing protein [Alphaproteobacteria bacterium]
MKHSLRWLLSLTLCLFALSPIYTHAQTKDADENPFPLLPGLENAVEFWKRIFTEYSLSQLVFFDNSDMSKIYEVMDIGEASRTQAYIDGERARIAAANEVDIDRVKAQRGVKERTMEGLKRSGRYIAQMQQIFKERNLPVELTYLPLVESSYDLTARSFVGALGIWQFMPGTGRQFMRVNKLVDERRDPIESTRAAASLLAQNYQALGNWPLALTAYNYGAGGLARAVEEIGSDNLVDLIRNYQHPYWGFAPKNFYAEFLAAVDIARNVEQYFPELELHPPTMIQEVEVKKATSVAALARSRGMTQQQLLAWNHALSPKTKLIPAGYRLKLPVDAKAEPIAIAAMPSVQSRPRVQTQVVRHRVKPGETLFRIARRYGASVERILQANGLRRSHLLRVGMTLLIPKA